jgi:hypothetical protein
MVDTAMEEKRKREDLRAKRNLLFKRYLKRPTETRLALEIKIIDDQIAEHTKKMERKIESRS